MNGTDESVNQSTPYAQGFAVSINMPWDLYSLSLCESAWQSTCPPQIVTAVAWLQILP